jgi:hypothetical protein
VSKCKLILFISLMCSMAPRSMRFGMRSRKLSNVGQSLDGWPKIYYLELLSASEGTLSRFSRLHLQSLAPNNPHWARVARAGYGPLYYEEGLCSCCGDINRLMLMMMMIVHYKNPLLISRIKTWDLWFRNLDIGPLDQPAVKTKITLYSLQNIRLYTLNFVALLFQGH